MNENLNGLLIQLGVQVDDLKKGIDDAVRIINDGSSKIESAIKKIDDSIGNLAKLGTALSASITLPLVALGKEAIEAYGDIQALQKGLESISGSTAIAAREFNKLKEVARLPGIGLNEAVKGSINLQAIGLSAGTARKVLLEFGNAVASVGKGRVEFERAIYGITQLANTPFPLGEDLNIIADALPQVRTLLQDAFGKTRSDDLAKMGVTSKQILDVILKGLGELPRVTGGVKNAFENLKDSTTQNLARIGERIDKAFDISGLINKLTDFIDRLISRFENLSPEAQKAVLIVTAFAAALGPVILGITGVAAALPLVINGFTALRTIVIATNAVMLANPFIAVAAAITAIGGALYLYYSSLETATDRQNRLNDALVKAGIEARNEQAELKKLYDKTQDHTLSLEERRKAVDLLQKQYPSYFANIKDEIILAGNASGAYKQLTVDILRASRARAAQGELDKRNASRLEEEANLQEKINQALRDYNNAKAISIKSGEVGALGKIGDVTFNEKEVKENARKRYLALLGERQDLRNQWAKEDAFDIQVIKQGQEAILKIDADGTDKLIEGQAKTKKERERQIAEVFPTGSIAELKQRAELLKKAIETSVNDIVKVRGLDKFGKDINKAGLPIFTGEILNLEQAYKRLESINARIDILEPPKLDNINTEPLKQFRTTISEFSDDVTNNLTKIGDDFYYFPDKIGLGVNKLTVQNEAMIKAAQDFNKSAEEITKNGISTAISDSMSAIGEAFVTSTNVFKALGKSMLSSFGNILGQLGQQLIQLGVGMLAIKYSLQSLNPYVAIAAGAALVALSGAIKGNVSKIDPSGSGNMSSSTGSNASTNYSSSSYTTSGGGSGVGEVVFRISGPDLIGAINRNVQSQDRLNSL